MKASIKKYGQALVGVLAILMLAACASQQAVVMPMGEYQDYSPEPYKIGVGDEIKVEVWGNEKLTLKVPVRPDGKISMSLIGDVLAAGKTAEGLSTHITELLLNYIKNPQVTVIVANPSSSDFQHRVRVTGAVRNPQSIPYRKGMTVMDVVLLAGGLNEFAQGNNAKLYRRVQGKVEVFAVYLDDILRSGQLETNYILVPSDIITVPERSF